MRLGVGTASVWAGAAYVNGAVASGYLTPVIGSFEIIAGVALAVGFLTPIAGSFAALGSGIWAISSMIVRIPDDAAAALLVVVMAAAVVLLGPGAYSADARLFGRREITIPPPGRRKDSVSSG